MPELKCWCGMFFEYDATDLRPYVYHEHLDGTLVANVNPNILREPKQFRPMRPLKTFWQDWQQYDAVKQKDIFYDDIEE